jgi:hypothetical protein
MHVIVYWSSIGTHPDASILLLVMIVKTFREIAENLVGAKATIVTKIRELAGSSEIVKFVHMIDNIMSKL